jgi:flagellar basal body P-ring protein FlgI
MVSAARGDKTLANLAATFVTAKMAPFSKVGKYS